MLARKNPHIQHGAAGRFLLIVMVTAGVCLLLAPVAAHPPSDMSVSYQEISRNLIVTITHQVPDLQNHYIKEVRVTINGKVVNDSFYTTQPTAGTFTYTYPVDTKTGDEIVVTATCSLAGSITRTLYNSGPLPASPSGTMADPPATKASAGLLPLIGTAAGVLLFRKKRVCSPENNLP
jgi:hypothetical protein